MTPHPREMHSISLPPRVDRDVVGHIDTHTHTISEEIFHFSDGACDLMFAWCDVIGRSKRPSSLEREIEGRTRNTCAPHVLPDIVTDP